jgi:RNA polymerase-binding transcription factor DksA
MTKEADDLDRAQELTTMLTDAFVKQARNGAAPEQVQNADGTWPHTECECGEQIPRARLLLGKIRCVACQEDFEKERRCRR